MAEKCPPADNCCTFDIKTFKTSFLLTINNFSKCTEKTGEMLKSSIFSAAEDPQTKWYLEIYPNGLKEENKEFISLFLNLESSDRKEVLTEFNFSLIDGNQKIHEKSTANNCFTSLSNWGYNKYMKRSVLKELTNDLLPNDSLTIHCEVSYRGERHLISDDKIRIKKLEKTLLDDMTALYENLNECDVDIVVNGHKFIAHKVILMARSPVFAAMFEHQMKEREQNEVIIEDIDQKIFEKVLCFIYTDKVVNEDIDSNMKLLSAADKYQLNDLKSICEEYISSQICVETVAQILILADNHSSEELKTRAIDFTKANAIAAMKTKGWKEVIDRLQLLELI